MFQRFSDCLLRAGKTASQFGFIYRMTMLGDASLNAKN